MKMNAINLIGTVHGDVRMLEYLGKMNGKKTWLCECNRNRCGKHFLAREGNILSGKTKSCGCLRVDHCRQIGKANSKHNAAYFPNGHDFALVFYENINGFFVIERNSYPEVQPRTWTADVHGKRIDPVTNINGKKVMLSRFLMGTAENQQCDHINQVPADNRICNMRNCTAQQNSLNRKGAGGKVVKMKDGTYGIVKFPFEDVESLRFRLKEDADAYLMYLQDKHIGEYSYRRSQEKAAKIDTYLFGHDEHFICTGKFEAINKLPFKNPLRFTLLMILRDLKSGELQMDSLEFDQRITTLLSGYEDYLHGRNGWDKPQKNTDDAA